jgi:hypothetical protein
MHGPINVKSPNNISKWQMGFNSAFTGLIFCTPFRAFLMSALRGTLDISNLCIALLSKMKCVLRVSNKCEGLLKCEALKRKHLP